MRPQDPVTRVPPPPPRRSQVTCGCQLLPALQLPALRPPATHPLLPSLPADKARLRVAPWDGYLKYYNLGEKVSIER